MAARLQSPRRVRGVRLPAEEAGRLRPGVEDLLARQPLRLGNVANLGWGEKGFATSLMLISPWRFIGITCRIILLKAEERQKMMSEEG